jgi:GWxTD domain-containing protein
MAASPMLSQVRADRSGEPKGIVPVSFEGIPLFGDDTTRALINIHYRIGQNFFIFVRNQREATSEEFIARGELLVELRDEQDISVAREIRQIRLTRTTQPDERERLPDIEGAFTFDLPDGEYTILFSLDDRESGRAFLDRDKKVTTRRGFRKALELSYPMFATVGYADDNASATFIRPVNHGTDVPFDSRGGYLFQLFLPPAQTLTASWNLTRQRDPITPQPQVLAGNQYSIIDGTLELQSTEGVVQYHVRPATASGWRLLYLPLPLEQLEPGSFKLELELMADGSKYEREYSFNVNWKNRPVSLMNLQLAVEALRHIATETEIEEMQTGSLQRNVRAFQAFWRQRDRDTTTAYNEVMVEYYRRVDDATQRFSTLSGGDGYKTDRGRIFILYGAPTRIDRLIPPGGVATEVWTYTHLKRRFVFSDRNRNGNLLLTASEDL